MIEFFDSLSWILTELEKSRVKIDHNLSNVKRKGDKIISQKLLRNHDFCLEAWERDKTTVHCIGYALNSILFHNGANFSGNFPSNICNSSTSKNIFDFKEYIRFQWIYSSFLYTKPGFSGSLLFLFTFGARQARLSF